MKTTPIPVVIKPWLVVLLVSALIPWLGGSATGAALNEQRTHVTESEDLPQGKILQAKGAQVTPEAQKLLVKERVVADSANKHGSTSDESSSDIHPWKQKGIAFGLPFFATQSEPCPRYPNVLSLADSRPFCHDNVALVSHRGVCSARTSFRFPYTHPGGADFEATALEGYKECLPGAAVAVIGVETEAVHVLPLREEQSPLPKDLESGARELLKDWIRTSPKADEFGDITQNPLLDSSPKVLKTAHITMLQFAVDKKGGEHGPVVLSLNGRLLRLEGWCTYGHLFFTINDKLYLSYNLECCGCGLRILYVYDLSGELPEKVYENDKLSD